MVTQKTLVKTSGRSDLVEEANQTDTLTSSKPKSDVNNFFQPLNMVP